MSRRMLLAAAFLLAAGTVSQTLLSGSPEPALSPGVAGTSASLSGLIGPINLSPKTGDEPNAQDHRAHPHPHGNQVCASGCALSNHPTPRLSDGQFRDLIHEFAQQPAEAESRSLDELLYYGHQTRWMLRKHGPCEMTTAHETRLGAELSRTHALIAVRLVDETGTILAHLPETRVPLNLRHVFDVDERELPHLEASGTVKRVGLHHLWTRI